LIKVIAPVNRYLDPMSSPETPKALELDIRPLCEAQRPPLPAILDAVGRLAPGQALLLIAPFEPAPLYQLLGRQGFSHRNKTRDDGTWEILFSRD
jgi:uncharacterized protein (DUF2249 family)